jgi:hypothetical protein
MGRIMKLETFDSNVSEVTEGPDFKNGATEETEGTEKTIVVLRKLIVFSPFTSLPPLLRFLKSGASVISVYQSGCSTASSDDRTIAIAT